MKKKESFAKRHPRVTKVVEYIAMAVLGALASNADRIPNIFSTGGDSNPSIEVGVDTTKATEAHTKEICDTTNAQKVVEIIELSKKKNIPHRLSINNRTVEYYRNIGKDGSIDIEKTEKNEFGHLHSKCRVDKNGNKTEEQANIFENFYKIFLAKSNSLPEHNQENKNMIDILSAKIEKYGDKNGHIVFYSNGYEYSLRENEKEFSIVKTSVTNRKQWRTLNFDKKGGNLSSYYTGPEYIIYEIDNYHDVDNFYGLNNKGETRILTHSERKMIENNVFNANNELKKCYDAVVKKGGK